MTSKLLIVGAGIAGLSLARRLSHYGLEFEIIERNPSEHRTGAGIALPFNAVRELEKLGVMEELAGKYHQVEKITYSTAAGKTLGAASLLDPPFGNDKFIALKRQDLHLALLHGFEKKVRFNTELLSIEHVEDKTAVTCSNELLNGKYDLVIAADGINSRIREQNYEGQATLHDHQIVCWRFIVTLPEHCLQPLYMMGNTDLFMAYPISPNALYCYGHIHEQNPLYNADASPEENVRRIFTDYASPVPAILNKLENVAIDTGRLKSVTEPRFFDRRIAFIGDAANGCSPLIQQGAAAALEDADCLSDALAMQNIDQALQSYRERRQSRIEWIMQFSDRPLTHIQKFDTLFGRRIRNLLIRTLGPVNVRGWKKLARDSRRLV